MQNYQRRLDAVEKIIAPRDACVHVVFLRQGQSQDEALATYAEGRGIAADEIDGKIVYLSWVDSRL